MLFLFVIYSEMTLEILMTNHTQNFDFVARLTPYTQGFISYVIIVSIISIILDKKMLG